MGILEDERTFTPHCDTKERKGTAPAFIFVPIPAQEMIYEGPFFFLLPR